jgi:hypothetical protein
MWGKNANQEIKKKQQILTWGKTTLINVSCACKLVHPLWMSVCRFLKKLKIELLYNPNHTTSGYITK